MGVAHAAARLWREADPLALVLVWAAATGGAVAWVAFVPGRPQYRDDSGQMQFALSVGLLVLFFLVRGSHKAQRFALFAAIFGVLVGIWGTFLTPEGVGFEPKFLGLAVLQVIALAALLSPPLERHVGVSRPAPPGSIDE